MAIKHLGYISLPEHRGRGGFDHADVHAPTDRLYVAHTSNDALDVIDLVRGEFVESVASLKGVAGALVSEEREMVFTSNRGEDTISMFAPKAESDAIKIGVGMKPNGLAFDAARGLLLAANVGDESRRESHTVSIVNVVRRDRIAEVGVPGRTRWSVFDSARDMFFVNIASPACIVAIDARAPTHIAKSYAISAAGPHGLDLDPQLGRLLCACDAGVLFALEADSGKVCGDVPLSGAPDVIFLHHGLRRLYVAIGEPGVMDVIDVDKLCRLESVPTEPGSHTLALDRKRQNIHVFLPRTHRAAVFHDAD